jgi:hypothetical protein
MPENLSACTSCCGSSVLKGRPLPFQLLKFTFPQQDLPALLCNDSQQLIISDDIDFGVVEMTLPGAYSGYGGPTGNLLPDIVSLIECREQAWALDMDQMSKNGTPFYALLRLHQKSAHGQ